MAALPSTSKDAAEKTSETSAYDPRLDFYSDKFDPLKALQTANIKIPVPAAKTFDNLAMYDSAQRRAALSTEPNTNKKVKEETVLAPSLTRKFDPHQMPIKVTRNDKVAKNIVLRMEQFDGPLAALKLCVDERTRLKVWTRHSHGIRGYCLAFCVAFDKHWNMALEDVTEVWTRPRSRKVPALGSLIEQKTKSAVKRRVLPPKITITKTTKKMEFCERHVPQLFVRGEQIAFINIVKSSTITSI